MTDPLSTARSYAERGWKVLPVKEGEKSPLTEHGVHDATLDPELLGKYFAKWPNANVAIATDSESAVLVLDVDPRNGGNRSLDELEAKYGPLPPTVEALTGGGGRHYYFRHPDREVRSRTGIVPGLDLKGKGGYVLAPPSRTSGPYTWAAERSPDEVELADAPEWLLEYGSESQGVSGVRFQDLFETVYSGGVILEGYRNDTLTSIAGRLRYSGADRTAIELALLTHNRVWCQPPLDASEVRRIAESVSRYPAGVPNSRSLIYAPGTGALDDLLIISIADWPDPQPRKYVVDGLIPCGAITVMFGDGGVGKSLLSTYIAVAVTNGRQAFERGTSTGTVLYIDTEMDADEFKRRVDRIACGMGVTNVSQDLKYVQLAGTLTSTLAHPSFRAWIEENIPTLIIIDSLALGAADVDLERSSDTVMLMRQIEKLGTVLVIDHVAKPQVDGGFQKKPFGSAFKHNVARSTIQISSKKDQIVVTQRKHNFGLIADGFVITPKYEDAKIELVYGGTATPRELSTTTARIVDCLKRNPDGLSAADVAIQIVANSKTVSNRLGDLRKSGHVSNEGGVWKMADVKDTR